MRKLTDFLKREQGFDSVTKYKYIEDYLEVRFLNDKYDLFLSINIVNEELKAKIPWHSLHSREFSHLYKSYLPMSFYLFLKIDFLKEDRTFNMEFDYENRCIYFRSSLYVISQKIDSKVLYLSPFLIAISALLPNFKKDRIILRGYLPEWV